MTTTTTPTTTKSVTTALIEHDGHIEGLRLDFAHGESITITEHQLTRDIANRGLWHGISAKLVDATAISRNLDTGRSASVDDKYNAAREVYERLIAGQWNKVRGDGTGTGSGGLLFRALCIMYATKTPGQIRAFLEGKTAEQKTALRKSPKIAEIIETLRAQTTNTDGIDTDSLLDELNEE